MIKKQGLQRLRRSAPTKGQALWLILSVTGPLKSFQEGTSRRLEPSRTVYLNFEGQVLGTKMGSSHKGTCPGDLTQGQA